MTRAAFLTVLLLASGSAVAQTMPNQALTPGEVAETRQDIVCQPGYAIAARHLLPHARPQIYRAYGIPRGDHSYVIDHRVPIELGGANTAANLWPQLKPEAADKDLIENALYAAVCFRHTMTLQQAQDTFLGDWRQP